VRFVSHNNRRRERNNHLTAGFCVLGRSGKKVSSLKLGRKRKVTVNNFQRQLRQLGGGVSHWNIG